MEDEQLNKYMDKIRISDNDYYRKGTRTSKSGVPNSSTDRANRATQDQVLDPRTRHILFKMINRGTFDELMACVSTGKEANVYRAVVLEPPTQYAVKVYKTGILGFKDRERYVVGEYRFRYGYSKSNPRIMVKLWAEKETRNLKRLYKSDIPVPKPLHLISHVLVMEFLGDDVGYASPKLKDADIDPERFPFLYMQLVSYMRIMYQECRLVHADLSEYNVLYHEEKLWIIDVSQSVEHDHPMSLEFLRMDIKNVNDYFQKRGGVQVFGERELFEFITTPPVAGDEWPETSANLIKKLEKIPRHEVTESVINEDAVFRKVYIPRNLNDVFDIERDVDKVNAGQQHELIYNELLGDKEADVDEDTSEEQSSSESDSDSGDEVTDVWDDEWDKKPIERKFSDREANKERKKMVKEEKKIKRANKIKKKDKKKIVAAKKNKKKT